MMKSIQHFYRQILFLVLLSLSGNAYAQTASATSFKLYSVPADPQVEQWMLTFTGAAGTDVTYTPVGGTATTVTIPAEQLIRVTIPKANLPALTNLNSVTSSRFIPVTATAPIQIIQEVYGQLIAAQDAALVFPESMWGSKYTVTSFNLGGSGTIGFNVFSATDNNSVIIKNNTGGTIATFTLNSGQNYIYNIIPPGYTGDIAGYTVEATNKVGVMMYSSAQTTADIAGLDNLVEYVLPDTALGTTFLSRVFATTFQMMITATQDNTTVKVNGILLTATPLSKGQTYQYHQAGTGAVIIETNFPVQMAKLSPGGNVQDPSFVNVLDVNKANVAPVIYKTLPNMNNENMLTIYTRTADTAKIRYNDQEITRWVPFPYDPSSSWATIASGVIDYLPPYVSTQFPLTPNTYFKVSSTTGDVPFITDFWGWGGPAQSSSTTLSVGAASLLAPPLPAACYKPTVTVGVTLDTAHGITALGRAGADNSNWPMVRKGAWTALEAKTKGFVVNRLTTAQIAALPAANLVEGMMVYNTTEDCLQINTDATATGWKCYGVQTCPD